MVRCWIDRERKFLMVEYSVRNPPEPDANDATSVSFPMPKTRTPQAMSGFLRRHRNKCSVEYGGTSTSGEECDQSIVSEAWEPRYGGSWRQACSRARTRSDHFSRLLEINAVHWVAVAFSVAVLYPLARLIPAHPPLWWFHPFSRHSRRHFSPHRRRRAAPPSRCASPSRKGTEKKRIAKKSICVH